MFTESNKQLPPPARACPLHGYTTHSSNRKIISTLCTHHLDLMSRASRRDAETSPGKDVFLEESRLAMEELAMGALDWVAGVGQAVPVLGPVVVALHLAASAVQAANRNNEQLEDMLDRCVEV